MRPESPNGSGGRRSGRSSLPNLWKRIVHTQPAVTSGASMWVLYMAGAMLLVIGAFTIIGSVLLVVGGMGAGWQGRLAGVAGVVLGLVLFGVGRWMTAATEPRR